MAALTPTFLTGKLPVGHKVIRSFSVAPTSNASATEWVDTGLTWIDAVIGFSIIGTVTPTQAGAAALELPNFVLNAQGTGVSAGVNPGDLGIEVASADATWQVTVIGKA